MSKLFAGCDGVYYRGHLKSYHLVKLEVETLPNGSHQPYYTIIDKGFVSTGVKIIFGCSYSAEFTKKEVQVIASKKLLEFARQKIYRDIRE